MAFISNTTAGTANNSISGTASRGNGENFFLINGGYQPVVSQQPALEICHYTGKLSCLSIKSVIGTLFSL
jgi:hypothetical protein